MFKEEELMSNRKLEKLIKGLEGEEGKKTGVPNLFSYLKDEGFSFEQSVKYFLPFVMFIINECIRLRFERELKIILDIVYGEEINKENVI